MTSIITRSRPQSVNGIHLFSSLLAVCLLAISIDIHGLLRLRRFEQSVHVTSRASGALWVTTLRKHGELLELNSNDGSYQLSCNMPGLGGSNSCDFHRRPRSGARADVEWIAAPAGLFDGTILFPVSISQDGEQIYQVPPDQVAKVQARKVMGDIRFLGVVSIGLALALVVGGLMRRFRRRRGATGAV